MSLNRWDRSRPAVMSPVDGHEHVVENWRRRRSSKHLRHARVLSKYPGVSCQSSLYLDRPLWLLKFYRMRDLPPPSAPLPNNPNNGPTIGAATVAATDAPTPRTGADAVTM